MGFCVGHCLVCITLQLYVHSSFAINLTRKEELVALFCCLSDVLLLLNALWLFHGMWWVGLQCVIVAFLDHTNFDFTKDATYRTRRC